MASNKTATRATAVINVNVSAFSKDSTPKASLRSKTPNLKEEAPKIHKVEFKPRKHRKKKLL